MSGWGSNVLEEGVVPLRLKPKRKAETPKQKTSGRRGREAPLSAASQDDLLRSEERVREAGGSPGVRRRLDTSPVPQVQPQLQPHPQPPQRPYFHSHTTSSPRPRVETLHGDAGIMPAPRTAGGSGGSGGSPYTSPTRSVHPAPRLSGLPASPPRNPSQEIAERMRDSWNTSLPFPFAVDLDEYDPVGSQKMVEFEKQRSELARQRYLETLSKCAKASEIRKMKREEELRAAKERIVEREAQRLLEQHRETQHDLDEEARREQVLQKALQDELTRVTTLQQKRQELRAAEEQLVKDYEAQLAELHQRERNKDLYLCRQEVRDTMKQSIVQNLELSLEASDHERARLKKEHCFKHQFYTEEMVKASEGARQSMSLHAAMELGRTMRLAGVRRADVAHNMGLIQLPHP